MKLYLAGPMTGYPDHNFPAFAGAAAALRERGHNVLSAHEILHDGLPGDLANLPHERYLRDDLKEMLECDGIVLLPGWPRSTGARLELSTALALKMTVFFYLAGELVDMNGAGPALTAAVAPVESLA